MSVRSLALLAIAPLALAVGCADDATAPAGNANVRFVNVTNTPLTIATSGTVANGYSSLGYGAITECSTVAVANPGIAIKDAAGAPVGSLNLQLQTGGNYVVIAYSDANGATQYLTVKTEYPTGGEAGLRVVNLAGASSSYDAYVTAAGAALGSRSASAVGFGTASTFFTTAAGARQIQLTTAGSQTVVASSGTQTLTSGRSSLFVVAPPAAGQTSVRTLFVPEC